MSLNKNYSVIVNVHLIITSFVRPFMSVVRPFMSVSVYFLSAGKLPFGQLPVLEVDGSRLAQSVAISRFVANELGRSSLQL